MNSTAYLWVRRLQSTAARKGSPYQMHEVDKLAKAALAWSRYYSPMGSHCTIDDCHAAAEHILRT